MILIIELIIIFAISKSIVFDTIHFSDKLIPKTHIVDNMRRVSSMFKKNSIIPINQSSPEENRINSMNFLSIR